VGLDDSSITSSSYIYVFFVLVAPSQSSHVLSIRNGCFPFQQPWKVPKIPSASFSQVAALQAKASIGSPLCWKLRIKDKAIRHWLALLQALAGTRMQSGARRNVKCCLLSHHVAQRPSKGQSKLECWLSLPEIPEKCLLADYTDDSWRCSINWRISSWSVFVHESQRVTSGSTKC
jgi:hypothetical protein